MYQLNVTRLRAAATDAGDLTGYAISRRTGLAESTISRLLRSTAQPGALSLMALCNAYGLTTDDLMTKVETAA